MLTYKLILRVIQQIPKEVTARKIDWSTNVLNL